MYRKYYSLDRPAFDIQPELRFFWGGAFRSTAINTLLAGITTRRALQLLTGEAGIGKTTLIRQLLSERGETIQPVHINGSDIDPASFYERMGFGLKQSVVDKVKFVVGINRVLVRRRAEGKIPLLVIDDAEQLAQNIFDELRVLLGMEKDGIPLISLLLSGRPEITQLFSHPVNRVFRHKLTSHVKLRRLNLEETHDYVEHLLAVAGTSHRIFEPESFVEIHGSAGGIPGAVNLVCTKILNNAAAEKRKTIPASFAKSCIAGGVDQSLSGELWRIYEQRNMARPTQESVVKTAISVAEAVEAAVSDRPDVAESFRSRWWPLANNGKKTEKGRLLLLVAVVAALLFGWVSPLYRSCPVTEFFSLENTGYSPEIADQPGEKGAFTTQSQVQLLSLPDSVGAFDSADSTAKIRDRSLLKGDDLMKDKTVRIIIQPLEVVFSDK